MTEDTSDLPEELLKHLRGGLGRPRKSQHDDVLEVIAARGGSASINQIIIDIYRTKGKIWRRKTASVTLYHMKNRGKIISAGLGVYAIPKKGG